MTEKSTMYSESVRVPFIVASSDKSRFPPGTVCDGFVELVDIAPTILGFCGENLSDPRYSYLDGHDLAGSPEHKDIRDRLRTRLQERVLGPDRVEYPWHKDTGQNPPFFKPVSPVYQGD